MIFEQFELAAQQWRGVGETGFFGMSLGNRVETFLLHVLRQDADILMKNTGIGGQKNDFGLLSALNEKLKINDCVSLDDIKSLKEFKFNFESLLLNFIRKGRNNPDFEKLIFFSRELDVCIQQYDQQKVASLRFFLEPVLVNVGLSFEQLGVDSEFYQSLDQEKIESYLTHLFVFLFLSYVDALLYKKIFFDKPIVPSKKIQPISFGFVLSKQPNPIKFSFDDQNFIKKNSHRALFTNPNMVLIWLLNTISYLGKKGCMPEALYSQKDFIDQLAFKYAADQKGEYIKKFKKGAKPIEFFDFLWLRTDSENSVIFKDRKIGQDFLAGFKLDLKFHFSDVYGESLERDEIRWMLWFLYRVFFELYKAQEKNKCEIYWSYLDFWEAHMRRLDLLVSSDDLLEWPREIRELAHPKRNKPDSST